MSLYGVPSRKIGPEPIPARLGRMLRLPLYWAVSGATCATFGLVVLALVGESKAVFANVTLWCNAFWSFGMVTTIYMFSGRQWLAGGLNLLLFLVIGMLVWRFAAPLLIASGIILPINS